VVALLSDEDIVVQDAAAKTLAAIGGRRDLVAFDAWLRAGTARKLPPDYLKDFREYRDALQKRLDEADKKKKK
jgi:hypothetical protein